MTLEEIDGRLLPIRLLDGMVRLLTPYLMSGTGPRRV
jgi:hypothetical protein